MPAPRPERLRLMLITDRRFSARPLIQVVREAVEGGATIIQLREKDADARTILALGAELLDYLKPRGVPLIIDDRVDLALALDADGVHLGRKDLPIAVARRLLGPHKLIGGTANTIAESLALQAEGADYLGVGAIRPTATKADHNPVIGFSGLQEIARAVAIPVIAIGGLDSECIGEVTRAGASGAAVVGAIMKAEDPRAAAKALRAALDLGLAP